MNNKTMILNTNYKQLHQFEIFIFNGIATLFSILLIFNLGCNPNSSKNTTLPNTNELENKLSIIKWVAYHPTLSDPVNGVEPSIQSITEDLVILKKAGFTGLVTYSCKGIFGKRLPEIANSQGFEGLILGIWNPLNEDEVSIAKAVSKSPIVIGYCVGNEGLNKRYNVKELTKVIEGIRKSTNKPVTTTEEIDDYGDKSLLEVGDWIFPNVHPYFHNKFDPATAVKWTNGAYEDLKRKCNKPVLFKEVGFPTDGDENNILSEDIQEKYYTELANTDISFVYFEAFDQPWKNHLPIEPYWGIFTSNRTPKKLGLILMDDVPIINTQSAIITEPFYVFKDAGSQENHFKPTGYMGDCGDINIYEAFDDNPHSGETCIKITYKAEGNGPNECSYTTPCKWAGVYWQEPPNNWGQNKYWQDRGFDLSEYNQLTFWAKANKPCIIEFKIAGIDGPFGDSQTYPRSNYARLTTNWSEFSIDLAGADLKHIIGGFCWTANWDNNPEGITFYLDEIKYVSE